MKIKFLIYTFLTFITMLILMIFILNQNKFNISDNLKKKIKKKYPNISLIHQIFKKESVILNLRNDYNVKFLPETQFSNLNLDKKKIIFNKKFNKIHQNSKWIYRSFYLDIFEEKIILADYLGGVYFIDSSKLLSDKKSEIVSPGHVFPLVARSGGVLERAGHTEASVDISKLSKLNPSSVICEVMNEDGRMARLKDLLPIGSIQVLKTEIDKSGEDKKGKFGRILGDFLVDDKKCTDILIKEGYAPRINYLKIVDYLINKKG